jgi:transcriptional regulator with XRE-family HTH domain
MNDQKDNLLLTRFGKHVKRLRENSGLSLREVSYRCNLDNSKISKIEQGKINITLSTVFELSLGLGVPANQLLDFKAHKQSL